jgi:hypothetical protein
MSFNPWNTSLKIWDSIGIPAPKVGIHLGVSRFIPSHSQKCKCDSQIAFLAYTFPCLCLGCKPKARVVTLFPTRKRGRHNSFKTFAQLLTVLAQPNPIALLWNHLVLYPCLLSFSHCIDILPYIVPFIGSFAKMHCSDIYTWHAEGMQKLWEENTVHSDIWSYNWSFLYNPLHLEQLSLVHV